jgi:hypothetical protein
MAGGMGRLLRLIVQHLDDYREDILHGEARYDVEGLIRLAGCPGDLTMDQRNQLCWEQARSAEGRGV